jgi:predicted ATPase
MAGEGYHHMPEAGRATIQDQIAIGGVALPWGDRAAFAEMMLGWELRSHHEARNSSGPVILDRGVPDIIGYLMLSGLAVPKHLTRAAELYRYNRHVFLAPHWPAFFTQDAERKQTVEEAKATHDVMVHVYSRLDYELISLPRQSVAKRVEFIKSTLPNQRHRPAALSEKSDSQLRMSR